MPRGAGSQTSKPIDQKLRNENVRLPENKWIEYKCYKGVSRNMSLIAR